MFPTIIAPSLMLGLCAMASRDYLVTSNRESGLGRYDIQLEPRNACNGLPGILIELEHGKHADGARPESLCSDAVGQLSEKVYATGPYARGVEKVLGYAAAFSGKNAVVRSIELQSASEPVGRRKPNIWISPHFRIACSYRSLPPPIASPSREA